MKITERNWGVIHLLLEIMSIYGKQVVIQTGSVRFSGAQLKVVLVLQFFCEFEQG